MLTKTILTATAIALVAGLGSASAGELFYMIEGTTATVLSPNEMAATKGADADFFLFIDGASTPRSLAGPGMVAEHPNINRSISNNFEL